MIMNDEEINRSSIRADRFEEICALLEAIPALNITAERKRELSQVVAHRAFMLAAVQTTDWGIIDDLFKMHCRIGFSSLNAQVAAGIVYAECALEFGNQSSLPRVVEELEKISEASFSAHDGHERLSLLTRSCRDRIHQKR